LLVLPQMVEIRWVGSNKKYYTSLGIIFTKIGDRFLVNVEKLSRGSKAYIDVQCDYCEKIFSKQYCNYINQCEKTITKKDCCKSCIPLKNRESNLQVRGVEYPTQDANVILKIRDVVLNKFGVNNVSQSEEIKQKKIQTNRKHFGVDFTQQSPKMQENWEDKFEKKYGVRNPSLVPEFVEKRMQTMLQNGNVRSSSQQLKIYNILLNKEYNVQYNYSLSRINMDMALFIDNIKIDIEYDSWKWHSGRLAYDRRRDEFTKSQGWKILRIRSNKKIPDITQIEDAICKLITTDRTFCEIILDDWGNKDNKLEEVESTSSIIS